VLHVVPLDAPADPIALAARLADRPGLAVLASRATTAAHGRFSYVACDPDDAIEALDPWGGGAASSAPGQPYGHVPRFVGVLPYEARRAELERAAWTPREVRAAPLVARDAWLRYPAVVAIDHARAEAVVAGVEASAVRALAERVVRTEGRTLARAPAMRVTEPEPAAAHEARVARAIEQIYAGDLYEVNLARRLELAPREGDTLEPAAIVALFDRLSEAAPTAFGACLRLRSGAWVVSTSPELLLDATPSVDGRAFATLATEPIKGTRPRSGDDAIDRARAAELDGDPKERAELAMVIDVERNDLARVAVPGSVEVASSPHLAWHRTVIHRVAQVRARVREGVTRSEVLRAVLPSGSVTGAPKVRAMEVIAALETARRGLYTGGFGLAAHDGSMRLAMAIRTAVLEPAGRGEYLVGGGIVADSIPAKELEETRWKSAQLEALVGDA
jgi:anthranilate/para-aminobenzoate synthase component I